MTPLSNFENLVAETQNPKTRFDSWSRRKFRYERV